MKGGYNISARVERWKSAVYKKRTYDISLCPISKGSLNQMTNKLKEMLREAWYAGYDVGRKEAQEQKK